MSTIKSEMRARSQLTILVFGIATLFALSFLPTSRQTFDSSEVRFSETSAHGMNIIPASCASSASYGHATLPASADGLGYVSPPNTSDYNVYIARLSRWVCVTNTTGSSYFVPANTASELNTFISTPVSGLIKG